MNIRLWKKFITGDWLVFYRDDTKSNWKLLKGQKGYWYADPILLDFHGKTYLFLEAYEKKCQLGRIAVSEYVNGEFTVPKVIISKPYHMSYPCTFVYKGTVYMIPETSQNRSLELFVSEDHDLSIWKKQGMLLSNLKCVDTTVYLYRDDVYLLSYFQDKDEYITKVYSLDMSSFSLKEIYTQASVSNNLRPAGRPFMIEKEEWVRPVQNNIRCYGESMRFISFDVKKDEWIGQEKFVMDTKYLGLEEYGSRTHTYARNDKVEIVDVLHEYFSFFSPIMKARRKINNLRYKLKYHDF